jgi:hypothetical protein
LLSGLPPWRGVRKTVVSRMALEKPATIGSDPERLKLKFSSLRFRWRFARGANEMQNFSVVAEIRKGFAAEVLWALATGIRKGSQH